jgi:hypothetical protein
MYCMAFIGMMIFNWVSFCYMGLAVGVGLAPSYCYYSGYPYYDYNCYNNSGWTLCFSVPALILNVFNFFFNCGLRKHEMISH